MWFDNNLYLRLVKKKSRDTEKSRLALTCADQENFFSSRRKSALFIASRKQARQKNFSK
jgi:hypothetical protein